MKLGPHKHHTARIHHLDQGVMIILHPSCFCHCRIVICCEYFVFYFCSLLGSYKDLLEDRLELMEIPRKNLTLPICQSQCLKLLLKCPRPWPQHLRSICSNRVAVGVAQFCNLRRAVCIIIIYFTREHYRFWCMDK